jgi:uncharacterized membrane protein
VSSARLVAVVFDDEATAEQALASLSDLADERALALKDAAVVVRGPDDDGGRRRVELRQRHALATGEGAVGGGTIGLLAGLVLGLPIAAALVGVAGGAGASFLDRGIPDGEMRRVGREIAPGQAAVFALVDHADWLRVREALEPYGGEVVASEVDEELLRLLEPASP